MRKTTKLGFLEALVGVMVLVMGMPLAMAYDFGTAGPEDGIEYGDFHSATYLRCNACHTMHYSEDGDSPPTTGFGPDTDDPADGIGDFGVEDGGPFHHLLIKKNVTDLCLMCHDDPTISPDVYDVTAGSETPGGDFAPSGSVTEVNGHNPGGDTTYSESLILPLDDTIGDDGMKPPGVEGGPTVLSRWTCVECHDEHGDTGEAFMYRNLKKNVGLGTGGYPVDVSGSLITNTAGPVELGDAEEAQIWTGSANFDAEANASHNVYRVAAVDDDDIGFGAWCAGCHGNFHGDDDSDSDTHDGLNWIRHPTAEPLTVATPPAEDTADHFGTLFDSGKTFIPLETTTAITFATTLSGIDAAATEQVMCLSCHRAHASDTRNAVRWNSDGPAGAGNNCNRCHSKGD